MDSAARSTDAIASGGRQIDHDIAANCRAVRWDESGQHRGSAADEDDFNLTVEIERFAQSTQGVFDGRTVHSRWHGVIKVSVK